MTRRKHFSANWADGENAFALGQLLISVIFAALLFARCTGVPSHRVSALPVSLQELYWDHLEQGGKAEKDARKNKKAKKGTECASGSPRASPRPQPADSPAPGPDAPSPSGGKKASPKDMSAIFFIMMFARLAGRTLPASRSAKPPCMAKMPSVRESVHEWSLATRRAISVVLANAITHQRWFPA